MGSAPRHEGERPSGARGTPAPLDGAKGTRAPPKRAAQRGLWHPGPDRRGLWHPRPGTQATSVLTAAVRSAIAFFASAKYMLVLGS